MEGGKLTGTLSRQAGSKVEQLPLQDATLNGSNISFATHNYAVSYVDNVLQPTDTNKWSHSKYQGAISGDTSKAKSRGSLGIRKIAGHWIGKLDASRPRLNKAPRYGTRTTNLNRNCGRRIGNHRRRCKASIEPFWVFGIPLVVDAGG